jgi:hypothetical protein
MFERAVQISASKASNALELDALTKMVPLARRVDEDELTFGERIDRNKALRGELPTTVSRRKRAEIDSFAADADEMTASLLLQFEALGSSASVIKCLEMALDQNIRFWSKVQDKAHEDDRSIISDYVRVRTDLYSALGAYLAEYYVDEG